MATPGSNLLKRAQKLIKFQTIQYYTASARTLNAARQWVPGFSAATPLQASVQALNRNTYKDLGLDFNKFYVQVFASLNIIDLQRDTSGDRFIYGNDLYQMSNDLYQMSNGQNWFAQDGWATCIAVRIKQNATGPD